MVPRFLIDFSHPGTDYVICTDEEFGFIAEACLLESPFEQTQPDIKKNFCSEKLNAFFSIIKKNKYPLTPENEEQFDILVSLAMEFYEEQALKHYSFQFHCPN